MVDGLQRPQGVHVRDGRLYIVDAGSKEIVGFDLNSKARSAIAAGLPVGPPPGVEPKPLKGMPPFSGPQGPFAGITVRSGRHAVCLRRRRRQRAGGAPRMTITPADHRYLQVARTLRKEIVDGVYPVGSQLPTEHELCERFAVSRYTVREALRRLRDDNLVASRPRAGTLVVPRPNTNSYAQDVMSINDLLAFAAGRAVRHRVQLRWSTSTLTSRRGRACPSARSGLRYSGYRRSDGRRAPICRTEYYINRTFAAVGRLLHRHTGPIFPLIEDLFGVSIVEVHQEISAVLISRELADGLGSRTGRPRCRCSAAIQPPTARSRRSPSTPTRRRGSGTR